jgi:Flp pilus assembly protein TadG
MNQFAHKVASRLVVDVKGAEIAEAAAVLPLMFMILLGIFWFGQAFSYYGAITRAAQEGARAAAAPYCTTCNSPNTATTNAVTAVTNALIASKLDPTQAQSPSPPVYTYCGTPVVSCPSTGICVQMPVQLASTTSGTNGVCGVSVSFQYPFQFWLPFASLNKQRIMMTATARVRLENQ